MLYLALILLMCIPTYAMQKEVINYQQSISVLQAFIDDDFIVSDLKKQTVCFKDYTSEIPRRLNLELKSINKMLTAALAYKIEELPDSFKDYIRTNKAKIQQTQSLNYEPASDKQQYELLCSYLQWQLMVDQELIELKSFSAATDDHKIILRRLRLKDIIQSQNILKLKKHVEKEPAWNCIANKPLLLAKQKNDHIVCEALKILAQSTDQKCTIS